MSTYTAGDPKYWRDRYYSSQQVLDATVREAKDTIGTLSLRLDEANHKLRNLRAVCVAVFLLFAGLALVAAHRMGRI